LHALRDLFRHDRPWTFRLMFLQIAHGTLQVDVLPSRQSWADLEKRGRAGFYVAGIPAFQNSIQIAALRAIHKYLICGDERSKSVCLA
jgi:hypothetical protein